MVHHAADRWRELVRQEIDRPDQATAAFAFWEDLNRGIVMAGPTFNDRIDQPAGLVVDGTSRSRATRPLKNVTMRSPLSILRSVKKPGATRRWTAPKSRKANQTVAAGASRAICLRRVAIACSVMCRIADRSKRNACSDLADFGRGRFYG